MTFSLLHCPYQFWIKIILLSKHQLPLPLIIEIFCTLGAYHIVGIFFALPSYKFWNYNLTQCILKYDYQVCFFSIFYYNQIMISHNYCHFLLIQKTWFQLTLSTWNVLGVIHFLTHLFLTTTLWDMDYYSSQFLWGNDGSVQGHISGTKIRT